jgi:hypothetical protein
MSGKVLSAEAFEPLPTSWGSPVERERRRRAIIAHAAYAYLIAKDPLGPEGAWDEVAESVDRNLATGHDVLDEFFRTQFSPMSAIWIYNHPELDKVAAVHRRYRGTNPSDKKWEWAL